MSKELKPLLGCLLAVSCNASFIKSPATSVRMVDAIQLHISATELSPNIGVVKLYLESVLDTRSQPQPFKTTAEVLLHGLKRTDRLSDVVEVLTSPRNKDGKTLIDHLEAGHVGLVKKRLLEGLWEMWLVPKCPLGGDLVIGAPLFDGNKEK